MTHFKKEDLITEKPQVKLKGFQTSQLKVIPPTPEDLDIQKTLDEAIASEDFGRLPPKDRSLVNTIAASYKKKVAGKPFLETDYVLSGHEFLEWDRLEKSRRLRYLAYRYRYSKYPELKIVDDYPPCVQIEPSSICNFRCIMCYQSDVSFSDRRSGMMGYMSLDLYKKVVDEIEGKLEAVTLASRGEPTLNKSFIDMLEYSRGKFLGLKVNSNASVLTEPLVHALFSNDVSTIVFSIDAPDKDLYEQIRVGGKFETLIKNLEKFIEIKKKHYADTKTIVRISGVKLNQMQDIERMNDVWKRYAEIIAYTNYTPWQSTYDNPVNDIEAPCSELWRRLFIWQDGKVNPCDYDYKSLLSRWDIKNEGVSEIWNSAEYNQMRRVHMARQRGQLEPCRRCISV